MHEPRRKQDQPCILVECDSFPGTSHLCGPRVHAMLPPAKEAHACALSRHRISVVFDNSALGCGDFLSAEHDSRRSSDYDWHRLADSAVSDADSSQRRLSMEFKQHRDSTDSRCSGCSSMDAARRRSSTDSLRRPSVDSVPSSSKSPSRRSSVESASESERHGSTNLHDDVAALLRIAMRRSYDARS